MGWAGECGYKVGPEGWDSPITPCLGHMGASLEVPALGCALGSPRDPKSASFGRRGRGSSGIHMLGADQSPLRPPKVVPGTPQDPHTQGTHRAQCLTPSTLPPPFLPPSPHHSVWKPPPSPSLSPRLEGVLSHPTPSLELCGVWEGGGDIPAAPHPTQLLSPPLPPPGQGPSKKAAKHKAAEVALKLLKGGDMLEPGAPEEPRLGAQGG